MMTIARRIALAFACAAVFAVAAQAVEGAASLLKDLTSVIRLLGMPCGTVVSAEREGENDHIATCSNGSRYRVFVNAQGRAVAEKQ
jgi:hypothetical protein